MEPKFRKKGGAGAGYPEGGGGEISGGSTSRAAPQGQSQSALLRRLCVILTGKDDDDILPHFKLALTALSVGASSSEKDEFYVAEKIKKGLARAGRHREVDDFTGLQRRLSRNHALKHREACLNLLLNLAEFSPPPVETCSLVRLKSCSSDVPPALSLSVGMSEAIPMPSLMWNEEKKKKPRLPSAPTSALLLERSKSVVLPSDLGVTARVFEERKTLLRPISADSLPKNIPESKLLRDILFVFQGINGHFLKYDEVKERYQVEPESALPRTQRLTLLRLAELGWLYRKVQSFCNDQASDSRLGLVGQAMVAALREELLEFQRLVAVLDAQLQQDCEAETPLGEERPSLTLRRLQVWTLEPAFRLRILAVLVDSCRGQRGGALASCLHDFLQHGDPLWQEVVGRLLARTCKPLLHMLRRWIVQGELEDPHGEFFIASVMNVEVDRLWHDKYSLRKAMVPRFLSVQLAQKVLATGKGINFLREVTKGGVEGSEGWSRALEEAPVEALFMEDQDNDLQATIETAYKATSRCVLDAMIEQFRVMDHLQAVRRYLLLGQGDFIRYLMELLDPELVKPVACLYPHTLTGILEAAVRATNAQFEDPEVLERLDVRLIDSPESGATCTGWDAFTLDYHAKGPIGTVLTHASMMAYMQLFNALWRCKRMEWLVAGAWKRLAILGKRVREAHQLGPVLHLANLLTAEMVHLVHQTQYYMAFEVMACSWEALLRKVREADSLDELVDAHQHFLACLMRRALMNAESEALLNHLRILFDLILEFQRWLSDLEDGVETELSRRHALQKRSAEREKQGLFGTTTEEEEADAKERDKFKGKFLTVMMARLRVSGQLFQQNVSDFLKQLTSQQDVSLQCLSFRLDFNEHYKNKDEQLSRHLTYQHRRQSAMGISFSSNHSSPSITNGH